MVTQIAPLPTPKLYPDDPEAILRAVYNTIYSASLGSLNDFAPHSPLAALSEGLLFAILEELYRVNKLPDAAGLSFLKVAGIQQILGATATVTLTFTLSAPLGNVFTLSAGYIVKDRVGHEFSTDAVMVIPSGQTQGSVKATASAMVSGIRKPAIGRAYNVAPYTIRLLTETRAFLKEVTNLEPATGGRDAETRDETIARGFVALRRREVLVSADDYEQASMEYLGAGSAAACVGRLAGDQTSYQDGAVHVFVLNPDRSVPNDVQINDLRTLLAKRSPAGLQTLVNVSPIALFNLEVFVLADLIPGSDPLKTAQRINQHLDEYFTPGYLPLGATVLIKEVENVVRNSGVRTLQSVSFILAKNGGTTVEVVNSDVRLPNRWTAAVLYSLEIKLVDQATNTDFPYSFGAGGDKD